MTIDVEIIEHDGKKYIRSEDKDAYIKERTEQIKTIQFDTDSAVKELEEIEAEELAEERTEQARQMIDKYGLDSSSIELVNVEDEQAFNAAMDYLQGSAQTEYGDPSAGFGDSKKPNGNGKKQREQYGRETYQRVRGR